jgi:hypothetical protein
MGREICHRLTCMNCEESMHLPTKCGFRADGDLPRPESPCAVVPSLAAWHTSPGTEKNPPRGKASCLWSRRVRAGLLPARTAARYLQPITCCRGAYGADRYGCTPRHSAEWARNNWDIRPYRSHPQQSQCFLSSCCFLVWCGTNKFLRSRPSVTRAWPQRNAPEGSRLAWKHVAQCVRRFVPRRPTLREPQNLTTRYSL